MLAVTALDGLGFTKIIAAGTYFLKKYRGVLNDINVFPVPDGDTGSNLYLTARSALLEAGRTRNPALGEVAAAAASGALLGARGNSGVILSQMFRGFANAVCQLDAISARDLGTALGRAVTEARSAVLDPVEGTILSVATAAAEEAVACGARTNELYALGDAIVRATSEALERTPQRLEVLREAGVVDAGAAGFLYFLEGILRFEPDASEHVTSYPRRANRIHSFRGRQDVSANRYCTEFLLCDATIESQGLKKYLTPHGDSLLVAGISQMLRVHIHTDVPQLVQSLAAEHGTLDRVKVDDMQQQHRAFVEERPARLFSFVAVVPGLGFERIARELGADETIVADGPNGCDAEISAAIDAACADVVVVLADNAAVLRAPQNGASRKTVIVVRTQSVASSLAVLVEYGSRIENGPIPSVQEMDDASKRVRATAIAAAATEGLLEAAVLQLGAEAGGLVTLYYGGSQKERDVEHLTHALRERLPKVEFEWFFGGQRTSEYMVAFER
ncbi:MAG: DAK2 domain-containing protein [Vulcanimicrobiaceae bacterium]|jgi:DAK2 domain fusion protein YloV